MVWAAQSDRLHREAMRKPIAVSRKIIVFPVSCKTGASNVLLTAGSCDFRAGMISASAGTGPTPLRGIDSMRQAGDTCSSVAGKPNTAERRLNANVIATSAWNAVSGETTQNRVS